MELDLAAPLCHCHLPSQLGDPVVGVDGHDEALDDHEPAARQAPLPQTNSVVSVITLVIFCNYPAVLPHHHGSGGNVQEEADRVASHALNLVPVAEHGAHGLHGDDEKVPNGDEVEEEGAVEEGVPLALDEGDAVALFKVAVAVEDVITEDVAGVLLGVHAEGQGRVAAGAVAREHANGQAVHQYQEASESGKNGGEGLLVRVKGLLSLGI